METVQAENGVEYVRSDLLRVPHGFSTRVGGVSTLPHTSSLNLAAGRGDPDETVIRNLSLFCEAVGVRAENVVSVPQIHSADVREVGKAERGMGYFRTAAFSCDGYVTADHGTAAGIKTADCVPILLCAEDSSGKPIAVGAVHAGWRGTTAGIVCEAVRKLLLLGGETSGIFAAVGPSVSPCCYEVGEDFYSAFDPELRERFVVFQGINSEGKRKYRADLKAANAYLLQKCGIPAENIDVSDECTCCADGGKKYFSHRRQKGVRGTMLSVIALPEE